jgi:hypothetical protein
MGKISYIHRISLSSYLIKKNFNLEQILHDRIDLLLKILPEGAEYHSMTELPITTIYRDTSLLFEHPYFPDGSKIELDYKYDYWAKPNDGGLGDVHFLTGIRYLDSEGKPLFKE